MLALLGNGVWWVTLGTGDADPSPTKRWRRSSSMPRLSIWDTSFVFSFLLFFSFLMGKFTFDNGEESLFLAAFNDAISHGYDSHLRSCWVDEYSNSHGKWSWEMLKMTMMMAMMFVVVGQSADNLNIAFHCLNWYQRSWPLLPWRRKVMPTHTQLETDRHAHNCIYCGPSMKRSSDICWTSQIKKFNCHHESMVRWGAPDKGKSIPHNNKHFSNF